MTRVSNFLIIPSGSTFANLIYFFSERQLGNTANLLMRQQLGPCLRHVFLDKILDLSCR